MKTLLDDRFAPITSTIGFFEAPLDVVGDAMVTWRRSLASKITTTTVHDPFPEVLQRLEPLTAPQQPRELLLATASSWTAYFSNFINGTDASPPVGYLVQVIKCRGLVVDCVPNTYRRGKPGRYGAVQFQLFGPDPTHWLNFIRAVYASNDGGRWVFGTSGEPLPFEETEQYQARKVVDRFTAEMLERYTAALGVHYFDPEYYLPNGLFIEEEVQFPPNARIMSLREVQADLGIVPPD